MRYTENKYDNEVKDLFDLVRVGFLSILTSPYRLLSEISTKIMFLDRVVIEKTLVVAAIMDLLSLIFSFVEYLITGKINLISGVVPLVCIGLSLVVLAVLAWLVSLKFEGTGVEVVEPVITQKTDLNTEPKVDKEVVHPQFDFGEDLEEEELYVPKTGSPSSTMQGDLDKFFSNSTVMESQSLMFDNDDDILSSLVRPSDLKDIDITGFFGSNDVSAIGELDKEILKDLVSSELTINKVQMNATAQHINRNTISMGTDQYKEELLK